MSRPVPAPNPKDPRTGHASTSNTAPAARVACLHARVSGRVQGVGFRYWTRDTAEALGLSGWVRNCANGDVELEAEGPRAVVEDFAERLRRGPVLARVRDMQTDWSEREPIFSEFLIRH